MNNIKTVFFMTLMGVIFLALGYVAGGRSGMTFALVFSIGINVFSYWFSDSMVLRMYNAREVGSDSRLYHIVQDLAKRDGLPVPRVYVIASDVPNAFATGRSPSHAAVAATEGILTMLDDEEIRGVLAHEMSHIINGDDSDFVFYNASFTGKQSVEYKANVGAVKLLVPYYYQDIEKENANVYDFINQFDVPSFLAGVVREQTKEYYVGNYFLSKHLRR